MSQIYVPEMARRYLKPQITDFTRIYYERFLPALDDIESEVDEFANLRYREFVDQSGPWDCVDPSSAAEQALADGLDYYDYLRLGKYALTSSWHVSLYQLFEQQLRVFLFREMSHYYELDFRTFCNGIEDAKKLFRRHNLNVEQLPCWSRIDELRLLCNVIKHGDGPSADRLRKVNPRLFPKHDDTELVDLHKSTLLEESLAIDETTLRGYEEALMSLWDEIPERSFST